MAAGITALCLGFATAPSAAGAPPIPGDQVIDHPAGIAFRDTDLAVAVGSDGSLRLLNGGGGTPQLLIGGLIPGAMTRGPQGVAVDGDGNVYVAAADDGAVYYVSAGGATGVYARDLGAPTGLAFDDAGTLYVADSAANRVVAVGGDGHVRVVAGGLDPVPYGLALGPDGLLYVSSLRTGKVVSIDPATGAASPFVTITGSSAEGLAFDSAGDLYVGAGKTGKVVTVTPAGAQSDFVTGLGGPLNLAFGPASADPALVIAVANDSGQGTGNLLRAVSTPTQGRPLAAPHGLAPTSVGDTAIHSSAFAGHAGIDAGARTAPLDSSGLPLPQGINAAVGRHAAEPTIGITADGTVFFVASDFQPPCTQFGTGIGQSRVFRSRDAGHTFTDVTNTQAPIGTLPPCNLDPYVYVDRASNRVFDVELLGYCSWLQYSDNGGDNWTVDPAACGTLVNDHETVAAGPPSPGESLSNGYPSAMYYCDNAVVATACGRSLDGGSTFTPVAPAFNRVTDGCAGLMGHVVVGPDGSVYIGKADCSAGPSIAYSRDGGLSWTVSVVAPGPPANQHEGPVAVDAAGNVYYEFIEPQSRLPYLVISRDGGSTWGQPMLVAPPGVTEANLPAISAGDAGHVALYFAGTKGDCCYDRTHDATTMWNDYVVISTNALDPDPVWLSAPMNDPRHPVLRGSCGPDRCGPMWDFLDVKIDNGGRTWTSLSDGCLGTCDQPGLVDDPRATPIAGDGLAGQLACGPRLRGSGTLQPPAWATDVSCGTTTATKLAASPRPNALPSTYRMPVGFLPWLAAAAGAIVALAALASVARRRQTS